MRYILTFAALVAAAVPASAQQRFDILIRGGRVIDGTGTPGRVLDVGIRDGRIVFVGEAAAPGAPASRTIDATGLTVAPGFIDPHTHTAGDLSSSARHANLPYLMQGVTTVVTNNDGGGSIEIGRTLDQWSQQGIGTNAAVYIGQGSVRGNVMGMAGGPASPAQLDSMRKLVARGMDEGALGMSTGLYYAPGGFAATDEVIELAKVAAQKGGIYETHMRDESSYTIGLIGSVNETIRIAREAHLPVHIAHIKALGVDVWGQSDTVIKLVDAARAQGLDVSANQYPYTASGTSVSAALLPRWAEEGGRDSLHARLANAEVLPRIVAEMRDNLRRRGGAASLLMVSTRVPGILGKNLEQVATERGVDPVETAIDIILAGGSGVASFNMNEADIRKFMVQSWVVTGSDGSAGHPRKYGTFAKLIHQYVEQDHVLTLVQAIHRSSGETAKLLQLRDRGTIAVGKFADVIVFNPREVQDRSTYREPELLATGMKFVLVNGVVAVDDGKYTGVLAGRALKR